MDKEILQQAISKNKNKRWLYAVLAVGMVVGAIMDDAIDGSYLMRFWLRGFWF
jgi:hypothetical protein